MSTYSDKEYLDALVGLLVGCKWNEVGPLQSFKPERGKYIDKAGLYLVLEAIIEKSIEDSFNNPDHETY